VIVSFSICDRPSLTSIVANNLYRKIVEEASVQFVESLDPALREQFEWKMDRFDNSPSSADSSNSQEDVR